MAICGGSHVQGTRLQSQGWWSLKTAICRAPTPWPRPQAGQLQEGTGTECCPPRACVPPGPRAQAARGPETFLLLDTGWSGLSPPLSSCSSGEIPLPRNQPGGLLGSSLSRARKPRPGDPTAEAQRLTYSLTPGNQAAGRHLGSNPLLTERHHGQGVLKLFVPLFSNLQNGDNTSYLHR